MQRSALGAGSLQDYGIPPAQFAEVLALAGDPVDSIPGIRNIGEKTALALLRQFGSLQAVLDSSEQVGGQAQDMAPWHGWNCSVRFVPGEMQGSVNICLWREDMLVVKLHVKMPLDGMRQHQQWQNSLQPWSGPCLHVSRSNATAHPPAHPPAYRCSASLSVPRSWRPVLRSWR